MTLSDLPSGLTSRSLTLADARAVFEVMAASELAVIGTVEIEEDDIVGDWSRPSFDVAAGTVGVFDGDRLLGYAEVGSAGRGDAAVHPEHLGRGIGTALARWMQQKAREQGQSEVGMPVPLGSPGEALLRALGYRKRWESWVLVLPDGRAIAEQPLPEGYGIRIAGEADVEPAYHVIEDAFLEWAVRDKTSLEDWVAGVHDRPGYEPWNLQVVTDPEGEVVGGVHTTLSNATGYVAKVAVRKDQRGKGLARGLLATAFAAAREHGATRAELATDSRTGALDLYLGLGMEIDSTWVNYGVTL